MRLSPHPVTLRQLQYIVAVADHQSFRKAADACHVSQPSLSAQVAQVEELLGTRLFERDKRHVMITSAGTTVIARARALLVVADDLVDAASAFADPFAGELRLGMIPTISPYLLPEVAPLLRKRFPRITLLWTEEKTHTLFDQLEQGKLDGIVVAGAAAPEHTALVIGRDPFVFAAPVSHRLAKGKQHIRPADLEGETVLLLDDGHCFREQALAVCAKAGADEAGYRGTSLQTLVQMAAGGAGVTLLPRLSLRVENRHGALLVRSFAPREPSRTLSLLWRKTSTRAAALQAIGVVFKASYDKLTGD